MDQFICERDVLHVGDNSIMINLSLEINMVNI